MDISLVICTRNRAAKLTRALQKLEATTIASEGVELVLVDSASSDSTQTVIAEFSARAGFTVRRCHVDAPGLGRARNEGLKQASGELIAFTDDDCFLDEGYFRELKRGFDPQEAQYGAGEVLLANPSDTAGASKRIPQRATIAPLKLLPAGAIQGANMFIHRSVLARVGGFNKAMGAGTPFPCEDIEFATRCSLAGFTGVLLPNVRIYHDHGRAQGSDEAAETLRGYDAGRGAYYASLLQRGASGAFPLWSSSTL